MPRGKQLSPKTRGKIEALHSVGHSVRQIAAFVRRSRNSVHQCLQRLSHGSTGVNARRPRKNPLLTENNRRLRLGWATTHTQWTLDDWKSVLFTDESKVSMGNDGALYVWRRKGEEFLPECCDRTVQHAASVMVWGSMCWYGVGSLVKLEGRLDSTAYQQVLEEHMLTDAAALIGDDFVFEQDNAPIHTSRSTRQWLRQHDVTLLDWPPKSPDANSIENLWHELKLLPTVANRELQLSSGMWNALQEAWQQIPAARVRNLAESVPRRLDAIRAARGGNTRY